MRTSKSPSLTCRIAPSNREYGRLKKCLNIKNKAKATKQSNTPATIKYIVNALKAGSADAASKFTYKGSILISFVQ